MSHSLQTHSAASPAAPAAFVGTARTPRAWERVRTAGGARPELSLLIALAAVLNLWALSKNGWANDYYSAAVRSMSSSWHDFLYASADPSGVMTVDKPPLALWVQSLSVRLFGYHPLSMLVPQALMGVASVALVYDLVRRQFGRIGGFVAGLALALTPMTVAISRHNNPDALLVLCCVAALWFTVRALQDGRSRWLVLAGAAVGLGFEAKMGVALVVVPAIAVAWLLVAPHGRVRALRQLLAGAAAMVIVGGAWPALMALTPAADRPWISGTSDNSIFSLMFEYNGLGRVDGQAGGPGGVGGSMFGGSPGPLRLLNEALGGQVGWLLGFAVVGMIAIAVATRLRRRDPRTGWLIAVGGAFLTTAVLFSAASGIFHPYYVALLAPFSAALVGAGAAQLIERKVNVRVFGPLALAAGAATELAVLHQYPGQLGWLVPVLIIVCALGGLALIVSGSPRVRTVAVSGALAVLLLAPSVWAFDTLGHATSGTFPAGGPASAEGPGGIFGARFGGPGGARRLGIPGGAPPFAGGSSGRSTVPAAPGVAGMGGPAVAPGGAAGAPVGAPPMGAAGGGGGPGGMLSGGRGGIGFGRGGAIGAPFGNDGTTKQAVAYVQRHGGGTIAVSSQSSAATAIISGNAKVAGIGGFSGRESGVTTAWLAQRVGSGTIRWVLGEASGFQGFAGRGLPGDNRAGSRAALTTVAKVCRGVTLSSGASAAAPAGTGAATTSTASSATTLYDCQGRAAALAGA